MVKDKVFKKEFAAELLAIAENDLQAARTLNADDAVRKETAMLMVQQSVEKGFKALLCRYQAGIPQTHDLGLLIDRVRQTPVKIPDFVSNTDFDELTPFATIRRYEEGHFEISADDMADAVELAKTVLDWVKKEVLG